MSYDMLETEVLIIGAGAAGLRTAIELADRGKTCLVLGKRDHGDAHTIWAAGGINASLGSRDPEDRWDIHAADTLKEGGFINDPKAVELLAYNAPDRVRELHEWGCDFNLTEDGDIQQRYFGAQSFRRTCFVGDRTGEAMLETLVEQAKERDIEYRDWIMITDLVGGANGRVSGAIGFDMENGELLTIRARATVVAAGGHASIYSRTSSRPEENNGDGVALCLRAGARLQDMEMIQFHPTGMVGYEGWEGRLVTEAVRGEGGRLYNSEGERFMEKYSPDQMELDARDVVARAIWTEIEEGRGTEAGGVHLDISHKEKSFIKERLPKMYERFKELDIDLTEDPIEVAPTTHYAMGGVEADHSTMSTGVGGLFCVGETTAGVHGANRLGGNSLCETVVFGKICGEHLADLLESMPREPLSTEFLDERLEYWRSVKSDAGSVDPAEALVELRETMWKNVGVERDPERMDDALETIRELRSKLGDLGGAEGLDVAGLEQAVDLHFSLDAAEAVVLSALERAESRGGHYRTDATETDDEWMVNVFVKLDADELAVSREPVGPIPLSMREAVEENHELDYHHLE